MKILNYGSMNIDNVYAVQHIAGPGETIMAQHRQICCGGKGLNQSIAIAKAGGAIIHAGAVGPDGGILLRRLEDSGVDTRWIKQVEGVSAHTVIQVDELGQNSIIVFADANITFSDAEMDAILSDFDAGDAILLQNELARSPEMMRRASEKGMCVIFNPSPINEAIFSYPLNAVDWFILNEIEGAALTGETDPQHILSALQGRYPRAGVVLTLGEAGAYCMQGDQVIFQPAFPTKPVDTTAAGDTFTGYFVTGLMRGEPLETVMRRAAHAASIAVSRKGAADSIPTATELME
ncbi:MAG: ribokinase [Butyricicoccaceae bacterium]